MIINLVFERKNDIVKAKETEAEAFDLEKLAY